MSIYSTDKKETHFYSNVSEKRVNLGLGICTLAVIAISAFMFFGDTSLLETHPIISMAVAIWFLGFAFHNCALVVAYAKQDQAKIKS